MDDMEGTMHALTNQQIASLLETVPEWRIEAGVLVRVFQFKDFMGAMRFVNQVAQLAEEAGHHPDIDIRYNRVRLVLVTHDAGGLSDKDFDLAVKADRTG